MNKRLKEIMDRKLEIRKSLDEGKDIDLDKLTKELQDLNHEEAELRNKEEIAKLLNSGALYGNNVDIPADKKPETRTAKLDSIEYRKAFMDYVRTGVMAEEFRSVAMTADNAAVIPATTLNEIVTKLENYGQILSRVRRVAYPAGLVVPNSVTKLAATWQAEGASNDVQDMKTGSVVFAAYQLRCAAGVSFQMDVKSLSAFESTLVKNVSEAMAIALETAIVNGTGVGQPTGILKATPVKTVTLAAAPAYKDLIAMVKAIPAAYKSAASLIMNEGTALSLLGMIDTTGQPIAHVNYGLDGAPVYRILGKEVVCTDQLPDIDDAAAGATVALAFDLSKYLLNSAYDMDLVQYIDNPTRNKVYDSIMLADGKVVDANGLVFINKAKA